jgi:hypothetical protein
MVQGYCLKEKKKVEIKDPKYEVNKIGRPVVRGKCSSCGGSIYKILKASEVPAHLKESLVKKGGSSKPSSKKSKSTTGSKKSKSTKGSKKTKFKGPKESMSSLHKSINRWN